MKTVHYISYYGKLKNNRNLYIAPSSVTKIDYVKDSLKSAGFEVNIFSTSWTKNSNFCYYPKEFSQIDSQETIRYVSSFGSKINILRFINYKWSSIQLLLYLLLNVKRSEIVLVYHSISYKNVIKLCRRIKNFRLIFEIEEIYSVAENKDTFKINEEIKYLKNADGYLLVNDLLAQKCGFNKPHVVSYSSYVLPQVGKTASNKQNTKINIVYAGIIENIKKGAFIAVETAKHLDSRYVINILGFGQEKDIENLKERIEEINNSKGYEAARFLGSKHGNEYSMFLFNCKIGLSTHTMDGNFVDYSFPSKLLVYLSHGLIPVCARIPCVEKSKINEYVKYYDDDTPDSVAEAVKSINTSDLPDYSEIIRKLDSEFITELNKLIEEKL